MYTIEDPAHQIIERPWEYEIISLHYHRSTNDEFEPYVDITLQKGSIIRRLRFLSPQSFEIEEGFPHATSGLYIADVRARGLDGLTVRVDDFEDVGGAVRFWARAVLDLDQSSIAETDA